MHRVASVTTMYNDDKPFSENAPQNKEMIDQSRNLFIKTIDEIIANQGNHHGPITLADFGAADGGATIGLLKDLIDYFAEITTNGGKREIVILFDDIPGNNFNELAKTVYDNSPDSDEDIVNNVHFFMTAKSMYRPCLPSSSLDLGFSCQFALQWLSARPTRISDGIFPSEANDHEMALIKEQAHSDWKTFLISRGRELKPGGCVVVFVGMESPDDNGRKSGLIPFPYKRLSNILKEFVADGTISQEEFHNINVDNYLGRTESDLREAFRDPEVSVYNLHILSLECVRKVALPPLQKCESSDNILLEAHAKKVTRFIRSCLYNSIITGLSGFREKEEKTTIAEAFFNKIHEMIREKEPNVSYVNQYAQIVVQKRCECNMKI